jgi:HlyD family secretion protein
LLAQLDPTFLQASVNEQKANVDRATAQFNESKRNYDRTTELSSRGLVSQADLDAATTSLESGKASLRQAEASLDRAQVNLRYATIRAPIRGVVISRNVDVGQTVAASLQAPTLFTIAEDLSRMQVQASIDEADIGTVKVGQRVTFRVDSYPEEEFEGTVSQIRLAPVVSQNVVTYSVIIDVANPEQKLMPGMTATVSVETARRDNVLLAPLQALRFTPPGMQANGPAMANRESEPSRDSTIAAATGGAQAAQSEGMQKRPGDRRGMRGERPAMVDSARVQMPDSAQIEREDRKPKRSNGSRGTIWVMENGTLKPLPVVRGIQNQRYAEMLEVPLNEGDSIIVGTTGGQSQSNSPSQGQTNPFMPRMPGSGGSRGR